MYWHQCWAPPLNSLQTSLQCCGSRFTKPLFEGCPVMIIFHFVQQQSRALWWYCSKMVRLRLWGTELKARVVPPICDRCLFVTFVYIVAFHSVSQQRGNASHTPMTTLSNLVQYTNEATNQKAARHFCSWEATSLDTYCQSPGCCVYSCSLSSFSFVTGDETARVIDREKRNYTWGKSGEFEHFRDMEMGRDNAVERNIWSVIFREVPNSTPPDCNWPCCSKLN